MKIPSTQPQVRARGTFEKPEYHVGFTGTREGMTPNQKQFVSSALFAIITDKLHSGSTFWFHHGDCLGADDEACMMAKDFGYKIWRHPALKDAYRRAYTPANDLGAFDATDQPYSYQGRNHRIVVKSQVLIAAPLTKHQHGGTWSTIDMARRVLKPLLITFHDNTWIEERITNPSVLDYLERMHDGRIGEDK